MSPRAEANRLIYGAALLYSSLGAFQVYLTGHAASRFFRLPLEKRRRLQRYVYLLAFILLISITRFILYIRETTVNLTDWPDRTLAADAIPLSPPELVISYTATTLQALVGDAFLVWRASLLWNHNRILKWFPVAIYAVYLGVSIFSTVLKVHAWKENFIAFSQLDGPNPDIEMANHMLLVARIALRRLFILDFVASVVVSGITTWLIIIRLLLAKRKMQRIVRELGGDAFRSTLPYGRVITLLLESALPFTLVGVAGAIATAFIDADAGGVDKASQGSIVMYAIWCNSLAFGPQLIIFQILSEATWTTNPTTHNPPPFSQPIRFTHDTLILTPTRSRRSTDDSRWHRSGEGIQGHKHENGWRTCVQHPFMGATYPWIFPPHPLVHPRSTSSPQSHGRPFT
ncbi:hypothetical protein BKA70DRAFT_1521281 [Coprinopsis sp. MPI-PUGE-AT-0042]|nr:hypothetical protein BKA70DRAFT_1521281 [Coprinopsis sp. MPI-PUGE-AT-0042]